MCATKTGIHNQEISQRKTKNLHWMCYEIVDSCEILSSCLFHQNPLIFHLHVSVLEPSLSHAAIHPHHQIHQMSCIHSFKFKKNKVSRVSLGFSHVTIMHKKKIGKLKDDTHQNFLKSQERQFLVSNSSEVVFKPIQCRFIFKFPCRDFINMSEERKNHKSGQCFRVEPEGLDVLMRNREVEHAFKQVGCWRFCEKLQGGHIQVTKDFAFNFTGLNSRVGVL